MLVHLHIEEAYLLRNWRNQIFPLFSNIRTPQGGQWMEAVREMGAQMAGRLTQEKFTPVLERSGALKK